MEFVTQFFLAHMKIKIKISYLGKKINILHRQMTEKIPVKVTAKIVPFGVQTKITLCKNVPFGVYTRFWVH